MEIPIKKNKKYSDETISETRSNLEKIIAVIYMFELQNIKLDINQIFEDFDLNTKELKKLELIQKYYELFKEKIVALLQNGWTWKRVSPFIRAVLLTGSLELFISYKALAINEMVSIVKEYTLDGENEYKFVNIILEKLSKKYEKEK